MGGLPYNEIVVIIIEKNWVVVLENFSFRLVEIRIRYQESKS